MFSKLSKQAIKHKNYYLCHYKDNVNRNEAKKVYVKGSLSYPEKEFFKIPFYHNDVYSLVLHLSNQTSTKKENCYIDSIRVQFSKRHTLKVDIIYSEQTKEILFEIIPNQTIKQVSPEFVATFQSIYNDTKIRNTTPEKSKAWELYKEFYKKTFIPTVREEESHAYKAYVDTHIVQSTMFSEAPPKPLNPISFPNVPNPNFNNQPMHVINTSDFPSSVLNEEDIQEDKSSSTFENDQPQLIVGFTPPTFKPLDTSVIDSLQYEYDRLIIPFKLKPTQKNMLYVQFSLVERGNTSRKYAASELLFSNLLRLNITIDVDPSLDRFNIHISDGIKAIQVSVRTNIAMVKMLYDNTLSSVYVVVDQLAQRIHIVILLTYESNQKYAFIVKDICDVTDVDVITNILRECSEKYIERMQITNKIIPCTLSKATGKKFLSGQSYYIDYGYNIVLGYYFDRRYENNVLVILWIDNNIACYDAFHTENATINDFVDALQENNVSICKHSEWISIHITITNIKYYLVYGVTEQKLYKYPPPYKGGKKKPVTRIIIE